MPITFLLQYMTSVAIYLAKLPWSQSEIVINPAMVVGYYIAIVGMCLYVCRKTGYNLRDSNIIE
jgi:hypothetical protein